MGKSCKPCSDVHCERCHRVIAVHYAPGSYLPGLYCPECAEEECAEEDPICKTCRLEKSWVGHWCDDLHNYHPFNHPYSAGKVRR